MAGIYDLVRTSEDHRPVYGHWRLPGSGESYESCGQLAWKACENVDAHDGKGIFFKRIRVTCSRLECPRCYPYGAAKEAHSAARRFEISGYASVAKHLVVSVSLQDYDASYEVQKARARKAARRCGAKGGCMIYHPWRRRCLDCGLEDESCRCVMSRLEWYYSPHFHCVVYGWIVGAAENYRETGYVVKNLGVRRSIYHTVLYQMTHAGVWRVEAGERILPHKKSNIGVPERQGQTRLSAIDVKERRKAQRRLRRRGGGKRATISWFGTLSYAKLHVPKEVFKDVCPHCGRQFVVVAWAGTDEPPPILRDALRFFKVNEFFIASSLKLEIARQVVAMDRILPSMGLAHLKPRRCLVCGFESVDNVSVSFDSFGRKEGYRCAAHVS